MAAGLSFDYERPPTDSMFMLWGYPKEKLHRGQHFVDDSGPLTCMVPMITTHIHVSISNVKPKKGESSSHAFAKCMKVETSMKVPSILERLFALSLWACGLSSYRI